MTIDDCQKELAEALKDYPQALEFIKLYVAYANLVDDIVDESAFQNSKKFLEHSNLAETVHSHPYYLANAGWLRPILLIVHNDYADSVEFEKAGDSERQQIADVLRVAGLHVINAIVYNHLGYKTMRELSTKFRYALWKRHKDEGH